MCVGVGGCEEGLVVPRKEEGGVKATADRLSLLLLSY